MSKITIRYDEIPEGRAAGFIESSLHISVSGGKR
jgi:hypothetical protein